MRARAINWFINHWSVGNAVRCYVGCCAEERITQGSRIPDRTFNSLLRKSDSLYTVVI